MWDELINILNSKSELLQNLVSIFTILGVIIGLVTVIITIINLRAVINQLKEMKLQRTHSQEPDLFIESRDLFVDYRNQDILFHAPWSDNEEGDFDKDNLLSMKLTNIGNGVAKYVSLKVFFEQDYLFDLIAADVNNIFKLRTMMTDNGMILKYQYGEKNKKQSMNNFNVDSIEKYFFNYIRPEQSVSFLISKQIYEILNIGLILDSFNSDSETIHRVKVSATYYDSFYNKYEKDIDIYIGSYTVHRFSENEKEFTVSFKLNGLHRLPEKSLKDVD